MSQLILRSFCLYFIVVDNAIIIVVHLGNFNIFSDQVSNREIVIMAPSFSSSFLFGNDWVIWTSYNPSFRYLWTFFKQVYLIFIYVHTYARGFYIAHGLKIINFQVRRGGCVKRIVSRTSQQYFYKILIFITHSRMGVLFQKEICLENFGTSWGWAVPSLAEL